MCARILFSCLLLLGVDCIVPLSELDESSDVHSIITHFKSFLNAYEKADAYQKQDTFRERLGIFARNVGFINAYNKNSSSVQLAINQFADVTADEFKTQYLSSMSQPSNSQLATSTFDASGSAPDSVDWRKKGAVSPVQDQKNCGACWAFSTVGAVEGAWALAGHPLVTLSVQELVDCASGWRGGCAGGEPSDALAWVKANGLCSNQSYPWTTFGDECHNQFNPCKVVARINGYTLVRPNSEKDLKAAVAQQPISVQIEADTDIFRFYKSGVLKDSGCGTALDHAVLAVGYGSDANQDYWLVKNSWGGAWGEEGYVRLARTDSDSSVGECGIAIKPMFPTVDHELVVV